MGLLNFSTTVAATRTLGQITDKLIKAGATQILGEYDKGRVSGLAFAIMGPTGLMRYRLPVDVAAVEKVMRADYSIPRRYKNREQAERVAWRILKDWLEAQLAILETQMVTLDQIMLPFMLVGTDTMYDLYLSHQLELGTGHE